METKSQKAHSVAQCEIITQLTTRKEIRNKND